MNTLAKIEDLPELGKDDTYMVVMYDKLAKSSSSIVFLNTLDLIERFFYTNTKNIDDKSLHDMAVIIVGVFNTTTLNHTCLECHWPVEDLINDILKERTANETRK